MIIPVRHSLHKFLHQVIIGLASHSLMPQPNVERVLQQRLQKHMEAEDRMAGERREYETNRRTEGEAERNERTLRFSATVSVTNSTYLQEDLID